MSNQIKDGGPAFSKAGHNEQGCGQTMGMSLRDWFAGMALAGYMANSESEFAFQWTHADTGEKRLLGYGCNPAGSGWTITRTPDEAMGQTMYAKADAMLSARLKDLAV